MSIPERLTRIVRHKISEMKDRFDQMDEEALQDPAEMERLRRAEARLEAKRELEDAMTEPTPSPLTSNASQAPRPNTSRVDLPPQPLAPTPRRTPQKILDSAHYNSGSSGSTPQPSSAGTQQGVEDPLEYHYRMLGLEPGCGFSDVQNAYNGLAARTDPTRFPAGSSEARELEDIRQRLEVSFRALRDALDSTAHRFGLLEFDADPAGKPKV